MMIARWQFQAKFGYKSEAIKSLNKWFVKVGSKIGWSPDKVRINTGSLGVSESLVEAEILIQDLNELNVSWDKLAGNKEHKKWGKEFEKYIVSGTTKWTVYRVVSG